MNAYAIPGLKPKDEIIDKLICKAFDVDIKWLYTRSRIRIGTEARQFAMWWRDSFTDESQAKIGARYGGRDHATVIHANKTVKNLMDADRSFKKKAELAIEMLKHLKTK